MINLEVTLPLVAFRHLIVSFGTKENQDNPISTEIDQSNP